MVKDCDDLLRTVLRFDVRIGERNSRTKVGMTACDNSEKVLHSGGCHCGAVRFEIRAPSSIDAVECNCSICIKSAFLHLIVEAEDFTLLQGEDSLTSYAFNTKTAKHLFCKVCGVKSYYVPRSHPSGYTVNVYCLDDGSLRNVRTQDFNGMQWESSIGSLDV